MKRNNNILVTTQFAWFFSIILLSHPVQSNKTVAPSLSSSWKVSDSNPRQDSLDTLERRARSVDKNIQRGICIKYSNSVMTDAMDRLTCLDSSLPDAVDNIKAVWAQMTGNDYPASRQEWREYICNERYFFLTKDIVDTISILTRGGGFPDRQVQMNLFRQLDTCPHIQSIIAVAGEIHVNKDHFLRVIVNRFANLFAYQKGINGSEDSYPETVDICDRDPTLVGKKDPYCVRKDQYDKDMMQVCSKPNSTQGSWTTLSQRLVQQHRCLEHNMTHRSFGFLRSCWTDVTGFPYPSKDEEFINFHCHHAYPNALRRIVDSCYFERRTGQFFPTSPRVPVNEKELQWRESNYPCAFEVWRTSEIHQLNEYRSRFNSIRNNYQRLRFCSTLDNADMTKGVILDANCLSNVVSPRIRLFLHFCWKFAAGKTYPNSLLDWRMLLCRESPATLRTIQHQVYSCLLHAPRFVYHSNATDEVTGHFLRRLDQCSTQLPFVDKSNE